MNIFYKTLSENGHVPTKTNYHDAGWDLYSAEDVTLYKDSITLIKTDIVLEIPVGNYGQIVDRSGMAYKKDCHVRAGVIDCGYRGEVKIVISTSGEKPIEIKKGDRIAQLVILPVPKCIMVEVDESEDSLRGENGLGASGD